MKGYIHANPAIAHGNIASVGQPGRHLLLDLAPGGVLALAEDVSVDPA